MSASRNLGLREARGPLIALLDGDDIWVPDKLERQVDEFAREPEAIMVCGASLRWHSWETGQADSDEIVHVGDEPGNDPGTRSLQQDRLYRPIELLRRLYPLASGATPSTGAVVFRREFAIAAGGFDESFRGLFEDQVFMVKAYLSGPIYVSSECVTYYRQHSESCCQVMAANGQKVTVRRRFHCWLKTYLDQVGCRDRLVRTRLLLRMARDDYPRTTRLLRRIRPFLSRRLVAPRSVRLKRPIG